MGNCVDFEKTKTIMVAFEGDPQSKVNLGIGNDSDELVLLLDGQRSHMMQVADDDFYELAKVYNQCMTWVRLDGMADQPAPYNKLSLAGPGGSGVSATVEAGQLERLQLMLQDGAIAITVEPDLLPDLDTVLQWFLLNVVTK